MLQIQEKLDRKNVLELKLFVSMNSGGCCKSRRKLTGKLSFSLLSGRIFVVCHCWGHGRERPELVISFLLSCAWILKRACNDTLC